MAHAAETLESEFQGWSWSCRYSGSSMEAEISSFASPNTSTNDQMLVLATCTQGYRVLVKQHCLCPCVCVCVCTKEEKKTVVGFDWWRQDNTQKIHGNSNDLSRTHRRQRNPIVKCSQAIFVTNISKILLPSL